MKSLSRHIPLAALALLVSTAAFAQLAEGQVRKVDAANGKVTLQHGPITNLDMPGMTMVFPVADKKLLDGVKAGDKVKFTAVKKDGKIVVTSIERAK